METKTEELKVIRSERGVYETPAIEDLGQIHEVTQNHRKLPNAGDSPQGRTHESTHEESGVVGG